MKNRCLNSNDPGFSDYGGRGITVCERWVNSFAAFLEDMGLRPSLKHSIDRIDVNGNYEPGNCRWATKGEQARNKRTNVVLTYNGKAQTLADWATEVGMPYSALWERYQLRGWSDERTLTTPISAEDGRFKTGHTRPHRR